MTTKLPRINVVIEPSLLSAINKIAAKKKKTISAVAKELMILALEKNEDVYFSNKANEAEIKNKGKKTISHEDAWK